MARVSLPRFAAAALALTASLAFAGWTQQGEGEATFDARGPAGFKIHGVAKKVAVKDDGTAVTVTVALADLSTDNGLRDKHLQEDVEAAKYPALSLTVPLAALKVPEDGKSVEAQAEGTFAMHGQSKAVPFTYKASCAGGTCAVEATSSINVKDFGVKIRSYLGITVKPDISIGAKFSLKR